MFVAFYNRLQAVREVLPEKVQDNNVGVYFSLRGKQVKVDGVPIDAPADYTIEKLGYERALGAILDDPFSPLSESERGDIRVLFNRFPKQIFRLIVNSEDTPERQIFDQVFNAVDFQNISYTTLPIVTGKQSI